MNIAVKVTAASAASATPLDELNPASVERFDTNTHWEMFERLRREEPVHFTAESEFGPSRGPGGRSRRMCRSMCHRGSAAAAAHTCAARSLMRSPWLQRAPVTFVLVAVHGLPVDDFCRAFVAALFQHRHMACGTPRSKVWDRLARPQRAGHHCVTA